MTTVISIKDLWKGYQLGVIGYGTLTQDLQSWWAKCRGRDDPNTKVISGSGENEERLVSGKQFWALQGINLDISKGEILGIVGKNGAGKSTLLKILSRITAPTKGEISIKGRISSLLEVGTGFHPELTGRENIFLNGAILGMSKRGIKNKLDEIIEFAGVKQHIDTPVKRYSSGMYVRLAFAVAAHLESDILVIDEVLAVGDASFQKKCLAKMNKISNEGRTILFVSHNLAAVNSLCSKSILIESGRICLVGNTDKVIDHYMNKNSEDNVGRVQLLDKRSDASIFEVAMIDRGGNNKGVFNADEEIILRCAFNIKTRMEGLEIYFRIEDSFGSILLHSSSNRTTQGFLRDFEKGCYSGEVHVPKYFLADGRYFITCGIQQKNVQSIDDNRQVLSFEVTSIGIPEHLAAHTRGGLGKIIMQEKWKVSKLS